MFIIRDTLVDYYYYNQDNTIYQLAPDEEGDVATYKYVNGQLWEISGSHADVPKYYFTYSSNNELCSHL